MRLAAERGGGNEEREKIEETTTNYVLMLFDFAPKTALIS